ncbi:unnamed protein product, partial [Iphiclides podalirius]
MPKPRCGEKYTHTHRRANSTAASVWSCPMPTKKYPKCAPKMSNRRRDGFRLLKYKGYFRNNEAGSRGGAARRLSQEQQSKVTVILLAGGSGVFGDLRRLRTTRFGAFFISAFCASLVDCNKDWALASDLWVTFEVSSSSSEMHDVEAGAGPPIAVIGMAWTCVARRRDDEPRQLLKI